MASGGGLESQLHDLKSAADRQEAHEFQQERMRYEEQTEVIQEMLADGIITQEEAQARMARGRMHLKIDEEGPNVKLSETAAAGADYVTTQQMLEDVLDKDDKVYCVRWLKKASGYTALMKKASIERTKRKKMNYKHKFPKIEIFVHGKSMRVEAGMGKGDEGGASTFELVLGICLLINGLLIGVQASMDEEKKAFMIMEHLFTCIFTLELIFRFLADGWVWIVDFMNFCDFMLIVLTGILPMWILGPAGIKSSAMRMLQVLRVLRLIKLIRMVRTQPMFRIFWTLIRGLLDSGRTLLWTYIMIGAVLYVFAIFGVYLIGKDQGFKCEPTGFKTVCGDFKCHQVPAPCDAEAERIAIEFFGDVPSTFVTLFQVMTLDSWTAIARPLMRHSNVVSTYFIIFILVVVLALGNLVTAVIINNFDENGQKDQEMLARQKREQINKDIDELKEMFVEIDADGSGMLSKDEYDEALQTNQRVVQKFELLGISADEQDEVFDLLDTGSGEIGVEQFAAGLRDLQGEAKAKDSFTICKKAAHINKNLGNLSVRLKRQQESADELRVEITEAHRQMGGLLVELRDVMKFLTLCMPPEDCKRRKGDLDDLDLLLRKRRDRLANLGLPSEPTSGGIKHNKPPGARRTVGFSEQVDEHEIPPTGNAEQKGYE